MITPFKCPVRTEVAPSVPDRGVGEELERQAALRVLGLARQGEAETEQAIDQPALGRLQSRPGLACAGLAQVGNDPVQPARPAVRVRVVGGHGPVADVLLAVVQAEPVRLPLLPRREQSPLVRHGRLERAHLGPVGEISERAPATRARRCSRRTRAGRNVRNGKPSSTDSSATKRIR